MLVVCEGSFFWPSGHNIVYTCHTTKNPFALFLHLLYVLHLIMTLRSVGSWKRHWEAGAHLPCKSCPYGSWLGAGSSSLLQGRADSEHGPCGQGDQHGGAADLQASQKTGVYTYSSALNFEDILVAECCHLMNVLASQKCCKLILISGNTCSKNVFAS